MGSPSAQAGAGHGRSAMLPASLAALGVVYGDIGTSPLYAIRECFFGPHGVSPTHENVLGVLSLVTCALVLVVSVKYIAVVLRADNQGEGGILALTALLPERIGLGGNPAMMRPALVGLGIIGAALLYGDGMITPAITVLSAAEGLEVITPVFKPFVVPISVTILAGVFLIQRFGTHRVGALFGPVMVVWFAALSILGLRSIVSNPVVLSALDPRHAVAFLRDEGWHGFTILGAVFLAVTGAEALYADMGHFGKRPIRWAWFTLVLPSLLLSYYGQGALLLRDPSAASQPFFRLAPSWMLLPLVVLATAAAIIASQALISGAFSLTRQAIQLGYLPRLDIVHTSSHEIGQVYVPQVNWALAVGTIAIVVGFASSGALAAAYGIAVTMTMVITALLLHVVMLERWRWSPAVAWCVTSVFLAIDVAFLLANVVKILSGGWLPLVIGAFLFALMTTWKTGRRLVAERLTARAVPLEDFVRAIDTQSSHRVPGTAVFMTAQPRGTPPALAHNLRYNKVLHEHVAVLCVVTSPVPQVPLAEQVQVQDMGHGVYNVRVLCGFMQEVDVPGAVRQAASLGAALDDADITYFLGRETLVVSDHPGMATWREHLFVFMTRNAVRATAFFRLPAERVVELGVQIEM